MPTLSIRSVAERSAVLQHACFGTGNSANVTAGVSGSAFVVLATDNSSRSQRSYVVGVVPLSLHHCLTDNPLLLQSRIAPAYSSSRA